MVPTQILCIMSNMHYYIMQYENFDCILDHGRRAPGRRDAKEACVVAELRNKCVVARRRLETIKSSGVLHRLT
jgi:hypothetical protein